MGRETQHIWSALSEERLSNNSPPLRSGGSADYTVGRAGRLLVVLIARWTEAQGDRQRGFRWCETTLRNGSNAARSSVSLRAVGCS